MSSDPNQAWFREHLVSYRLRQTPSLSCGVLVIGSGVAGCVAALTAARSTDVLLVCKRSLVETNTSLAQGGIAATVLPGDSVEAHVHDTLLAGGGLCEESVVQEVCRHGPETVQLLAGWGVGFDRNDRREWDLHQEGGHSALRVLHAMGDATGRAIQEALAARVASHPGITCLEQAFALELLMADGDCRGALVSTAGRGLMALWAEKIILASGGGGQVFRETTNPAGATGDGFALAFRAGATLRDLEFVQFHPTALYVAGAGRFLISESVRGAGAVLRDRSGRRIMVGVHPLADLAPRDVVSRTAFRVMAETQDTHVYLDLTGIDGDPRRRFPAITEVCASFGIDVTRDMVPVRPAAHYFIGGVRVDRQGRTGVPNLFAVGEVASTGLHGANRLASNSLLEGAWCGAVAGQTAAGEARGGIRPFAGEVHLRLLAEARPETGLNAHDMIYSLKALMNRNVGIEREAGGLAEAVQRLIFWSRCLRDRPLTRPRTWELANMLLVAVLIARSALRREESRGVHFRADFPEAREEAFRSHTLAKLGPSPGEPILSSEPLGPAGVS